MHQAGCPVKIRVLLADDHVIVRDAIRRLLQMESDLEVVGQAADGVEAVEQATLLKPDVVVMDVGMPYLSGIEATRRIKRQSPGIRVIGLSMYEDSNAGTAMREAGASQYLPKSCKPQELVAAIQLYGHTDP